MCDSTVNPCRNTQKPIFWGCPAPLARADYNINNPPFLRPFLIRNQPYEVQPFRVQRGITSPHEETSGARFRVQTEAIRQPSRGATLEPWNGQPIPPRAAAYISYASW